MIKLARERMRTACEQAENLFGAAFFEEHVERVREFALELAPQVGADPEIVELAAYLHDAAAVADYSTVARHAEHGALLAAAFLAAHGYPADRAERVAQAIRSHSTPVDPAQSSPEEVCVSHGDAMAQIARPAYWIWYGATVRQLGFEDTRQWWRERVESHWSRLLPAAQATVEAPYRLTLALLDTSPKSP